MTLASAPIGPEVSPLVRLVTTPQGGVTAEVVGLPEIRANAPTREEALEKVRAAVTEWLASGQFVRLNVPTSNAVLPWFGWAKGEPESEHEAFREELRRQRDDLDQGDQEGTGGPCSATSSIPTT